MHPRMNSIDLHIFFIRPKTEVINRHSDRTDRSKNRRRTRINLYQREERPPSRFLEYLRSHSARRSWPRSQLLRETSNAKNGARLHMADCVSRRGLSVFYFAPGRWSFAGLAKMAFAKMASSLSRGARGKKRNGGDVFVSCSIKSITPPFAVRAIFAARMSRNVGNGVTENCYYVDECDSVRM